MPELPDVDVYVEHLNARIHGQVLQQIRCRSVFVLRTTQPPLESCHGRTVRSIERLGKQIVIGLEGELYLLLHLMIAGRLRWRKPGAPIPKGNGLTAFDFARGTLIFTEASKKKRASLRLLAGTHALAEYDRGGLEVLSSTFAQFDARMRLENHTLKRALTDPRILSGIGNAYSDEILHRARMSPARRTQQLDANAMRCLFDACGEVLTQWRQRLRDKAGTKFPDKVTAFHEEMGVHGKYGQPCPVCARPVQRIVYAENESNYCAGCQTDGRLLVDRALSKLLKQNWPKRIEDLES